jgi:DNA-binding response OmpR family regulator
LKILLVEDDEWIAEPLLEALSDQHYVVSQLGSGSCFQVELPKIDWVRLF